MPAVQAQILLCLLEKKMTRHCARLCASPPCRWPRLAPRSFGRYWTCVAGQEPQAQRFGDITAVDADSGTALWNDNSDAPMLASAMPTAGEVLPTGDTKRLRCRNRHRIVEDDLSNPISGMVLSMLNGLQ